MPIGAIFRWWAVLRMAEMLLAHAALSGEAWNVL